MSNEPHNADSIHMQSALELSQKSKPSPNPRVGALIVKNGKVIAEGFHERPGAPHAEINALALAGTNATGADLFVTLEPCCHQGKTGPCVEAIIQAGISRVVVGMVDPDPRVQGHGISKLENSGIAVTVGVLASDCAELLAGYTIQRTLGRPLIILKAAVTLDGMIATVGNDSKWISSNASREYAHHMRSEADAILVGVETVIKDNPDLTVRLVSGPSPIRIVVDSSLRTPVDSKLIKTAHETPSILAYVKATEDNVARFDAIDGVQTILCNSDNVGRVDLGDLSAKLGKMGILSLLVEGGGKIHGSFTKQELADRIALFVAPRILGSGISWNSFSGTKTITDGIALKDLQTTPIGDDILVQAKFTR